eukprot:3087465-Amphidinium_carterae.1
MHTQRDKNAKSVRTAFSLDSFQWFDSLTATGFGATLILQTATLPWARWPSPDALWPAHVPGIPDSKL